MIHTLVIAFFIGIGLGIVCFVGFILYLDRLQKKNGWPCERKNKGEQ